MQSFILPLVHALWPNDILEHSHAGTVAPCEITAIINPEKGQRPDYSRKKTRSHKTQNNESWPCPSIKESLTQHWKCVQSHFQGIRCSHKNNTLKQQSVTLLTFKLQQKVTEQLLVGPSQHCILSVVVWEELLTRNLQRL